ncbi:hypothetical protein P171DRAFT_428989 [Karstenula rhodostoma CBS 690.94]|uniref:NAD(P)-binding protein n=1 Tax=Karstenula rhodostoma CBS 690.94 TaxID=1392251 RepID=A0A9P4PRV5_9PLEO|nr:hypothetical protein P171DRAFT_428989 [Karstenula rhodostoma CBS 690.94]
MTWSLNSGVQFSKDRLELGMAVNTLAHFNLVLRLLGHVEERGRIVFLSSESHWPGKAGFEVYPPVIPEDMEELVKYEKDVPGEEAGRGFLRYGLSKLAGVMLMYELNRRLQKQPALSNIRVLAVDPGGILANRCALVVENHHWNSSLSPASREMVQSQNEYQRWCGKGCGRLGGCG